MTLETAYLHMKELVDTIESNDCFNGVEMQWYERAKAFVEDFKTWTPEIYIHLENGHVLGASANCSMHFNLWDDENEKVGDTIYFDDTKNQMSYDERMTEWDTMIEEDKASGKTKVIY